MIGVCPTSAQIRRTVGISMKPDSSTNTMCAPSRAAFFYPRPVLALPLLNANLIAPAHHGAGRAVGHAADISQRVTLIQQAQRLTAPRLDQLCRSALSWHTHAPSWGWCALFKRQSVTSIKWRAMRRRRTRSTSTCITAGMRKPGRWQASRSSVRDSRTLHGGAVQRVPAQEVFATIDRLIGK
jgi:hypothetical protein